MYDDRVAADPSFALDTLDRVGRALADGTRRRILLRLARGGAYPAELAGDLGVSRPGMSNHLSCLRDCGLVVAEPEGRRVRYRLADGRLAHALADLSGLRLQAAEGHA
ncbi:MAG: ArsR family transcriptional regulator, cadmium/lead-responsive transcriptional repressor [Actinomycetota bacterium]|jgi:DNA-binding transcriptional ArsR family regulator|nr:ArsR family transcriptional regulator, cadmium/lead-responsive transcriptional repressor [Actinomycetota bacterium]